MSQEEHHLLRFYNCSLLRDHRIFREDLWVRNGVILNPKTLFYEERVLPDQSHDLEGALISPGLIDLQINGAFGYDFSTDIVDGESAQKIIGHVSTQLLAHGVTSFCPTIVTSPETSYKAILPHLAAAQIKQTSVLGLHLEGPFISKEKKGAHPAEYIRPLFSYEDILDVYGNNLESVKIITLAPEILPPQKLDEVITRLTEEGITVSLGHSVSGIRTAEQAVSSGASMVTHLFNAMSAFHHRADPGLIGLLTKRIFFGLIADGIHSNDSALTLAYRTNFEGLCLVTDAVGALGLSNGEYKLGQLDIVVVGNRALVKGTKDTLCGATTHLLKALSIFRSGAGASEVEALEAATLHPAAALGIQDKKGTLDFGSDADFIVLQKKPSGDYHLVSTWTNGRRVYTSPRK